MSATHKVPAFSTIAAPGIRARGVPLFKRPFDILAATAILLAIAPLLALIALSIKLGSRGPVFFRQERVGRHGRRFQIFKFRTMVADAAQKTGPVMCSPDDPRITPLGRVLRTLSIDEIPQLMNGLKGDLSRSGPRPERPVFVQDLRGRSP